jgi:phosphopantothenoylcysteine decarboxylase / phosphopantothenate---cysteine ligase
VFRVGFAAETERVVAHAQAKLATKHLDLIVVNDVSQAGIGMGADDNEVTLIDPDGGSQTIARAPKSVVADSIMVAVASRLR